MCCFHDKTASEPSDAGVYSRRPASGVLFGAVAAFVLFSLPLFATPVGTIDYFEGELQLTRNAGVLDEWDLVFGESLSEGDVLETGATGSAEVTFVERIGANIVIGPNTAYSVSVSEAASQVEASVDLFYGRVRMIADGGRSNRSLSVRSGSAVAGVRGTEFDVMTAPDGSILVGTRSGVVVTQTPSGQEVGNAGRVVEVLPTGAMSSVAVPVERIDDYFDIWLELRTEAFSANPGFFISPYLQRFEQLYGGFMQAARRLATHRHALENAVANDGRSSAQTASVRTQVSPAVVSARSSLSAFEENYFSLVQLSNMLSQADRDSLNAQTTRRLSGFERERGAALRAVTETRHLLGLFDQIDFQIVPGRP